MYLHNTLKYLKEIETYASEAIAESKTGKRKTIRQESLKLVHL